MARKPGAAEASHVHASLRLSSGVSKYRQGELIHLELVITSDEPRRFVVASEVRNRWGILETDQFHVTPAKGAIDPLALYEHPFLNNERRFSRSLNVLPRYDASPRTTIQLPLTEWIRFDQPGRYKVWLRTTRVATVATAPDETSHVVPLDTNAVKLEIIPADEVWQEYQLREIASQAPINWIRLRALGTAEAARLLARRYRPEMEALDHEALLGLFGSPNRCAGIDEMKHLLNDPDFGVTPSFLEAISILTIPSTEAGGPGIRARMAELLQQLPSIIAIKRGQALVTTRQAYSQTAELWPQLK